MTKELRSRMMLLLDKIDRINKTTNLEANFHLDKESLGIWVDGTDPHFSEFVLNGEITECRVYEIYMGLDDVEFKHEKSTVSDDAQDQCKSN